MLDLPGLKREALKAREEYDKGRGYYRSLPRGEKMILGLFTVEKVEALIAMAEKALNGNAPTG